MRMMNPSGTTGPGGSAGALPRPMGIPPRVRLPGAEAALPLDKHIRGMLSAGATGRVNLYGPPGSGKSFAMNWVKASLDPAAHVEWVDTNQDQGIAIASDRLVVFTTHERMPASGVLAALEMAPW